MDRGSLRALKLFTNVGYALGFLPYKFQVLSQQVKEEDTISLELDLASRPNLNGFDDESGKEQEDGKNSKGQKPSSSKRKIVGGGIRENSKQVENFDIRWRFQEGTRARWWLLIFSMALQYVYVCFLIFRSIEAFLDDKRPPKDKMPIYYLTVTLILLSFFQMLTVKEYDQLHVYLNAVGDTVSKIRLIEPVNGRGEPSNQRSIKVFGYSALALGTFVPLARCLGVFLSPRSKLVVTSLLEDPTRLPLWQKLVAAAFHFQVAGFSTYLCWFYGVTVPWYVASILPAIQQKRTEATTALSQDFLYKSFNMLSVLQMNFSQVYGYVALAMEACCLYITVFNIFLGVVHGSFASLVRALILLHLQNNFFSRLGEIHTASEESIRTWREQSNGEINWFTKFQRSIRPLRIYIGSFFYVDQSFVLTLTAITLDQSVNLILSYK